MKKLTLLLFTLIYSLNFFAQSQTTTAEKPFSCGVHEDLDEFIANNPELALKMKLEEEAILRAEAGKMPLKSDPDFVIPVVFHILHTGGAENISDEQIYSAMEKVNQDFNKGNNWDLSHPSFVGIAADVNIEFRLATKDNAGNCHKGITRTFTQTTHDGTGVEQMNAVIAAHGQWPSTKYINVFVVDYANGAGGYTSYPAVNYGSSASMRNGIWVLHTHTGSIGTSNLQRSTAFSHEVGHWLNLIHTWGNTNEPEEPSNCSDDDNVGDTPNTIGWRSCTLSGSSCSSLDNVENFMEYSYCSKMFTEGQKTRMHNALGSALGGRNNVVSPANLIATGVDEDPDVLCNADFRSDKQFICPGSSIQFFDDSYHTITSREWSFPGGSPSSSSDPNPLVTYNNSGIYEVSLTVSHGAVELTETKTAYIQVLNSYELPYTEDFQSSSSLATNGWTTSNTTGGTPFTLWTGGGENSAAVLNYGIGSSYQTELISPTVDLDGITPLILSYKYAYKSVVPSDQSVLQVFFSSNCGTSWSLRREIQLGNESETQATSFLDPSGNNWKEDFIEALLFTGFNVENFRFKFRFVADGGNGNNLFIDDINIYNSALSVADYEKLTSLKVFPNPTNGNVSVSFNVVDPGNTSLVVKDNLGRVVYTYSEYTSASGNKEITVPSDNWANGIYFIQLNTGGNTFTKKLIRN